MSKSGTDKGTEQRRLKNAALKKMTEAKRPKPPIGGRMIHRDDPKATIDRFLHRHQMSAWKTWRNLEEQRDKSPSEAWSDSACIYWRQVVGTIAMLRYRNFPRMK